ncbi:MAG: nitrate reductase molybdenum cofactor assembly chaperone [Anaerolineae bacterium]
MDIRLLLAEAFCYPRPGLLELLEAGLAESAQSPARSGLAAFVKKIGALSLAEWEELATRTLDLSPAAAPYVGFQIWGESYQRGEFMAKLNRAMTELKVDLEGELPDHLVPVLRYLAVAERPLPELLEHFAPAVERMIAVLREKDKDNPYIKLFEAAKSTAKFISQPAV